MPNPILVMGAGSWGTALSLHLARNHNSVILWSHDKNHIESLQEAKENLLFLPGFPFDGHIQPEYDLNKIFEKLAKATYQDILIAVPSFAFEEVLHKIKPYMHAHMRLLWATKGLAEDGKLLHELVIANKFPLYGVLSGPSFAKEVAAGKPTAVAIATNHLDFSQAMSKRFHSPQFRVYTSSDIIGVELGGAIKNVLAIAVALAEGLGFGSNAKAALMTRGLAELRRLTLAMNTQPETIMGLSGMGDIVLTCTDNQSRNRRFGLYLAEGLSVEAAEKKVGQVVEGKNNVKQILALFKRFDLEAPICTMVYNIIYHHLNALQAVDQLLMRPPREEFMRN